MTEKKTATEVQMEREAKMKEEWRERLLTDDKLFRATVLARLESLEELLRGMSHHNYQSRWNLFG